MSFQFSFDSKRNAALVFPVDIFFTKALLTDSSSLHCFVFGKVSRCWMVEPSSRRSSRSPAFQEAMHLSKQAMWSLDFEEQLGFCRRRGHIVNTAFRATDSRVDPTA